MWEAHGSEKLIFKLFRKFTTFFSVQWRICCHGVQNTNNQDFGTGPVNACYFSLLLVTGVEWEGETGSARWCVKVYCNPYLFIDALLLTGHLQGKAEWQRGVSILCSFCKRENKIFMICAEPGLYPWRCSFKTKCVMLANVPWAPRAENQRAHKWAFRPQRKLESNVQPVESFLFGLYWVILSATPNSRALK